MPANQSQIILLQSLRARLALDRGLGVEFMAVPAGVLANLSAPPLPRTAGARAVRAQAEVNAPTRPAARQRGPESVDRQSESAQSGRPPEEPRPAAAAGAPGATLVPYAAPGANPAKEAELSALRAEAESCAGCELQRGRTRVVWGEGSLDARVMFVGEAPGRDEDQEGRPFVGRAGMLLTDIIEKGMRLPRSAVYIANVVKCRPPGNRDPKAEELAACARYTARQFEVVRPEVVVAVGGVAGCALLGLPARTAGLRGKWHDFRGTPLRVIYHPSYLLRQRRSESDRTAADREVWADIQEVMKRLEEQGKA